jgi:hypothetical protein
MESKMLVNHGYCKMLGHAGIHARATEWPERHTGHQRCVEGEEINWWKQVSQAHGVATKGTQSMSECMHGDKQMLGVVAKDSWIK